MPLYIVVLWLEHIQNLHFFYQISIKFSYSFWCLILGFSFWDFGATWRPNGGFWEPLGGQLGPKWRPKSAKGCPKLLKWRHAHFFSKMGCPFRRLFFLLRFWCGLVPKRSILGAPWRAAGPKMAPKIILVVPKSHPSGAKKGPESIIPRTILRHRKRALTKT